MQTYELKGDMTVGKAIIKYIDENGPDAKTRRAAKVAVAGTILDPTGQSAIEAAFWAGIAYAKNNPDSIVESENIGEK